MCRGGIRPKWPTEYGVRQYVKCTDNYSSSMVYDELRVTSLAGILQKAAVMNGKWVRIRSLMLVVGFILSILTLPQQASGSDVGDTVLKQMDLCKALGGEPTVSFDEIGTMTECKGGLLDGLVCDNGTGGTRCWFKFVQPGGEIAVPPSGGIEVVPQEPLETLEVTENASAMPVVAEDPTMGEAVIIANQPGSTAIDNAESQVNGCRAVGGDAIVTMDGSAVTVLCQGEYLDGLWCLNDNWGTICWLPTSAREATGTSEEDDGVLESPMATIESADDPTAPVATATEASSEPTPTPTEVPVVPTAVSEHPPVIPTIPTNNDTVPPGPIEEPEPSPTEPPVLT